MAQLDPSTNTYVSTQQLRGGLTLNIVVGAQNQGVATVSTPVTITGGANTEAATTTVTAKGMGSTDIFVTQPAGFVAATNTVFAFKPMPSIKVTVF
jgi:hypothetical protein